MSEMSEGVKQDLEFIRSTAQVTNLNLPTGHAFLANLLRSRDFWTVIIDLRDRALTIALLKALPSYSRGDVHLVLQPCDHLLFLIMLLRKRAIDVVGILDALSPLSGGRAERRRIAKGLMHGRDIVGIGKPTTGLVMLGLLHMLDNAAAPN
jgi:hypothetical protein